ncbi:MAG: N-acetylmuramidase domain-containing protein [Pseudomonadota bacterium]
MNNVVIQDPYFVKKGDTLNAIAKAIEKSVAELKKLNGIVNVDQIEIGQTLYLSQETAFGVSVIFLDALRHPIDNLFYKIKHDGQTKSGQTKANGALPRTTTKDAKSRIEISAQDFRGQWISICNVTSDYGHKLVTLVSDALVFKGGTELHPKNAPAKPESNKKDEPISPPGTHAPKQPAAPKPAGGSPSKNNPAVKTKKTKGKHGQAIIEISVDIPKGLIELFSTFIGGEITDQQWKDTATRLDCEPAVLKAFAEVESGGRSSFWRLNKTDGASIPAILYERHYFSHITNNKYDKTHPDISWSTPYRMKSLLGTKDTKMNDGKVNVDDIYSSYSSSYLRLINAYRLVPDAALKSCSWGKFQIMGENFKLCGQADIDTFVQKMCTSEASQIALIAEFIRNKPRAWKNPKDKKLGKEISLWDAVKAKNWAAIAFNYNGPSYKTYQYDTQMKAAYEKHSLQKI